jgi:hypothetical protein
MEVWMILQYSFALAFAIGCIALIISKWHIIERAEEQELWKELEEKIVGIH